MKVTLERDVDTPEDVSFLPLWLRPAGEWMRLSTDGGSALVFYARDESTLRSRPGYLLHWIEAETPGEGHGSSLLAAVGQMGDQRRASGSLICQHDLVPWYSRFGWVALHPYCDTMTAMGRYYSPEEAT